jgi:cell division protein FtsN
MLLGAIGVAVGVGYVTWTFTEAPSPEATGKGLSALVTPGKTSDDQEAASDETEPAMETRSDQAAAGDEAEVVPSTPLHRTSATDPSSMAEPRIGAYYVQVASFKDAADADASVKALTGRGLQATVSKSSDSAWNKVRLGPYDDRAKAEAARFELGLNERQKAYVLPRSNGKFHVQVGSFATREQAEPVMNRLIAQGHATKISRIKMGDRRWHCVRVGPFDTYEEASGYQKLVGEAPGSKSRVIPFAPSEHGASD